jgi:hypothetical protein
MNKQRHTAEMVFHQDPIEDLLKIFDAAFRVVVPGPGREVVGLKAISEKQNGAPGWYLWFEDRSGAYLLELADAGRWPGTEERLVEQRNAVRGNYRIKYYPDLEDPASLQVFSASEQIFRKSDCFDQTGTPAFEWGEEIPETFFQIGTIEVGLSASGKGLVLCLGSCDRWVTRIAEGVTVTDDRGCVRHLRAPGEKDRDVPAWDWSWFLMDRLILTLCLAYSSTPWCVALYDAPGYTFRIHRGGVSRSVPDESVRRCWLSISFHLHDGHASCLGPHSACPVDPSLLLDAPPGERLVSYVGEPGESHPWVSSVWWHVRENPLDLSSVLPC